MPQIVVDTNYFINNREELRHLAQTHSLLTTPSVLQEINDPASVTFLKTILPQLKIITPEKVQTQAVARFSKKTGDFTSLSITDMELIALSRQLIYDNKLSKYIRKRPKVKTNKQGGKKPVEESLGWGGGWDSDDESGFVGEKDLENLRNGFSGERKEKDGFVFFGVGIVTEDFAMQNIILQMGIPLLNKDGKAIQRVKSFVLECFSCWKISRKTDKIFCKACGKNTLLKVTCEFNDEGEFTLFRKKGKQIKVRGSRFPIPEPKGGRDVTNELILYEDDFLKPKVVSHLRTMGKRKKEEERKAGVGFDMGLGFDDMVKTGFQYKVVDVGYGKRNPNQNRFWKNKKNKKKKGR